MEMVGRAAVLDRAVQGIASGSTDGVLVTGRRGVGRSTLLAAVADRLSAMGLWVERLAGTVATRHVPLAAMAPLLPDGTDVEDPATVTAVLRLLAAGPRRRAVVLDDADLLDPGSVAVVVGAVVQRSAMVVMSCPDDVTPDDLAHLRDEARLDVVALDPLPAAVVDDLLAADGLERDPSLPPRHAGVPAIALAAARDRAVGASPGAHQVAVVRRHLDRLHDAEWAAVDLLVAAAPLPPGVASTLTSAAAMDGLEQRGTITTDDRDGSVRLADDWLREVLAHRQGDVQRRRLRVEAARALRERGRRDEARVAAWLLDGGEPVTPGVLVRGAETALRQLDTPTALRLARAAVDAAPDDAGARLVHGSALSRIGRGREAEQVLRSTTAGGEEAVDVARARAHNLAMVLADAPAALEVLAAAWDEHADLALLADTSLYALLVGDLATVLDSSEEVLAAAPPGPVRMVAATNRGLAEALRGQLPAARAARQEAERLLIDNSRAAPLVASQLATQRVLDALASDALDDAVALAEAEVASSHATPDNALLSRLVLAGARYRTGDLDEALRVLDEWSTAPDASDPHGMATHVLPAYRARVHAERGDLDRAEQLLAVEHERPVTPRGRPWFTGARATVAFQRGEQSAGVATTLAGARSLRDLSHLVWAAEVLHVPVRMGAADDVVDQLVDLAGELAAVPAVQLFASHARAAAEQDAASLVGVAREAAGRGAWLVATEAALQAAAAAAVDDDRAAVRAATLARWFRRRVTGAATPALALDVPRLTERQVEVALLAPSLSSQAIADRLHLATRTVENHLQAAYRRLGVTGRDDLADFLGQAASLSEDDGAPTS